MFVEVDEAFLEKIKLILGDGLEDVFVIIRKEEELSATTALPLHQVEHLFGIVMQFERFEDTAQIVAFEQSLEHLGGMDSHITSQHSKARQQIQIDHVVLDYF